MSTLKTSNLQHASAASPAIVLAADGSATLNGLAFPTSGSLSGRNRIINGDMRIDQRNAGAAVTGAASFPVDRFFMRSVNDGAYSGQQDSSVPAGFAKSTKITVTTADSSLTATQSLSIRQRVEGYNIADFAWGTASAVPVTLSFWVRSSVTGTYGGSICNGNEDRSYPFTFAINSANTWEQKTVTIAGDTSGTWATDNSTGLNVFFSMGAGPDRSGTAGAWNSNTNYSATGAVNMMATLNATFYITGVQLEAGTVATPFERRSYGQELSLCQRYFCKSYNIDVVPGTNTSTGAVNFFGSSDAAGNVLAQFAFPVSMRANPTIILYRINGTSGSWDAYRNGATYSPLMTAYRTSTSISGAYGSVVSAFVPANIEGHWTASTEL